MCILMNVSRGTEQARVWFRSERVFFAGSNQWYFQTREGIDVGPYDTQFEAEIEAGLLKELLQCCNDYSCARSAIREFVLDSYAMGRRLSPRFREDELEPKAVALG